VELARRESPEYAAALRDDGLERLWSWVEARLAAPEIRTELTREGAREAVAALLATAPLATEVGQFVLEVEAELPFLHRQGNTLMEGIIDRLVLVRSGSIDAPGPVLAAHILDYKTDFLPPGDETALGHRTERYRSQLHAYRDAVAAMYGIPPERVRLTLLFLEPGRTVEVD